MSTNRMLKPDIGERSFGSAFDPVLSGVAQGLARLFPLVEGAVSGDKAAETLSRRREDRPADVQQVACRSGLTGETGLADESGLATENQRACHRS